MALPATEVSSAEGTRENIEEVLLESGTYAGRRLDLGQISSPCWPQVPKGFQGKHCQVGAPKAQGQQGRHV